MSDGEGGSKSGKVSPALLNVPSGRSSRSASPQRLSTELILKVRTQQGRLDTIRQLIDDIPQDHKETSLQEVTQMSAQLEEVHKAFLKEHSYFEMTWMAALIDHEYFAQNTHGVENRLMLEARRALGRLKHALTGSLITDTAQDDNSRFNSRLPDISLPRFDGDYASWPTFRELFTCFILDNTRLTNVEKLHYLRGCMSGPPAQLISSLTLTGSSLQPSWELLIERYENKRLIIQAHLDQMFSISTPTQRNAASLNEMLTTVSEANKALHSLGMTEQMWDCFLVHHVSRHLDRTTREQWETSLGSSQSYPRFAQLEAFLTSRARALERIESSTAQVPASSTKAPASQVRKPTYAHQASAQPSQQSATQASAQPSQLSATQSTSSSSLSSTVPYPCDCCNASHFIVMCTRFRDLSPADRVKLAINRRLCFNCLGRHNARSCRSSRGCKKCPGRHHTMLHEAQTAISSAVTPTASTSQQPSR